MKKQFIFLLIFAVTLTNFSSFSYAEKDLKLTAKAAILIDAKDGKILYEKNSSEKMFPASTTKILTAIIAIESSELNEKISIDQDTSSSADGTHIGLLPDEVLSMNDLLHALLINSANDSAVAIAKHISGSVENFSKLMNQEAIKMGAKNSNFINPNGLPDENHVSSAYDLAMIARYAMKNDVFREIVKKSTYTIEPTNKKKDTRVLKNSNKLLYSDKKINVDGKTVPVKYEGVEGIKTGYTKVAGQCLVSGVKKSNGEYISVILQSVGTDIYADTHKLFNYSSKNSKILLAKKNEFIDNIDISGGSPSLLTAVFKSDFSITPDGESVANIEREFVPKSGLKAPVALGQVIGKVNFKNKDEVLGSVNVISTTQVVEGNNKLTHTLDSLIHKWWFWLLIALIVLRTTVGIKRILFRAKKFRNRKRKKVKKKFRKKGQTIK